MDNQNAPIPQPQKPYGRNWKKWVLIYVAIAAVLYAGIYYFVLAKQDSAPYSADFPSPSVTNTPSPITTSDAAVQPTSSLLPEDQLACTQEAKMCPDDSYVGREGPNCEFAECPGE